jgi:hypothetical protein
MLIFREGVKPEKGQRTNKQPNSHEVPEPRIKPTTQNDRDHSGEIDKRITPCHPSLLITEFNSITSSREIWHLFIILSEEKPELRF